MVNGSRSPFLIALGLLGSLGGLTACASSSGDDHGAAHGVGGGSPGTGGASPAATGGASTVGAAGSGAPAAGAPSGGAGGPATGGMSGVNGGASSVDSVGGSSGAGAGNGASAGNGTGGSAGESTAGTGAGGDPLRATPGKPVTLVPAPGLAGPALKLDLDMSGRPTSEVTALNYQAWPVTSGATLSSTFAGVTFTLKSVGTNGTGLAAAWEKAAVDAPNYARLVGDGVTVEGGELGSEIELTLHGLPAGAHSLLTFHNYADAKAQAASVDVLVNGTVAQGKVAQGLGALADAEAPSSYVTFTAEGGKDVVIGYRSSGSLMLNGFELDTPNLAAQASTPAPADGDEHVDADAGSLELAWKAAKQAASHDVYFGLDPDAVIAAVHAAPEFKGNQSGSRYSLSGLHSIERYYWRVDEVDAQGGVTRGNVWYFRPRQLAFPGAEGYGRFAIGGRGGVVVHVTNLLDAGPGSLRDAVETDRGPRVIVFDVSGVIPLASRLSLTQSYVTVAGQTAPGKGICVRAAPFGLSGPHDAVIRHVRVRLGHGPTFDGMGMAGAEHSIIDHSSISWTIDEAFSSRNAKNITLQRTLISECLNDAGHQNYPAGTQHGYAASIGGDIGSFHHNLLAHCEGRNWSLAGGLDASGSFAGRLDIFDNVVYNWKSRTTDGGAHEVNFVNNYYKPGAASAIFVALNAQYDSFPGTQQYYVAGNVMPGHFDESTQDKARAVTSGMPDGYEPWVTNSWFPSYATVETAGDAYKSVLSDVGVNLPIEDEHDARVIKETLDGTYTYKGSLTGLPGLPDTEADVGGYEDYPTTEREASWDSDGDGLPDWWEQAAGLEPHSPSGDTSDANVDLDGDGYTELEGFLAWMATPHYTTSVGQGITVALSRTFPGYTKAPVYSADAAVNGTVSVSGTTATFTPDSCGRASWVVKVTDGDGASMMKSMVAFVDDGTGSCAH